MTLAVLARLFLAKYPRSRDLAAGMSSNHASRRTISMFDTIPSLWSVLYRTKSNIISCKQKFLSAPFDFVMLDDSQGTYFGVQRRAGPFLFARAIILVDIPKVYDMSNKYMVQFSLHCSCFKSC